MYVVQVYQYRLQISWKKNYMEQANSTVWQRMLDIRKHVWKVNAKNEMAE